MVSKPTLSLIIPSAYPHKLIELLDSFDRNTKNVEDIEIIVCRRPPRTDYQEIVRVNPKTKQESEVLFKYTVDPERVMAQSWEHPYSYTTGEWILWGGDDIIFDTFAWDQDLRDKFASVPDDKVCLIWGNDGIFEEKFSVFPIVHRSIADEYAKLFPQPYKKYKTDDTLIDIVPVRRRYYLPNTRILHNHFVESGPGFRNKQGKIYPTIGESYVRDDKIYKELAPVRAKIRARLSDMIGEKPVKVMIGVSTAEFSRHAAFYDYFNLLDKPVGSVCSFVHGQSPAKSRNLLIEAAKEHDCTHVFLLDDDMVVPSDTLTKLLARDVDIVSALYLMRQYPHQALLFDHKEENGQNRWYEIKDGQTGLMEVTNTGLGCVLFKLEVFDKISEPYVRLGEIEQDGWCDDIGLFNRLQEAGVKIHVDLDVLVGHIGSIVVTPVYNNGKWSISYNTFSAAESINFPMPRRNPNGVSSPSK